MKPLRSKTDKTYIYIHQNKPSVQKVKSSIYQNIGVSETAAATFYPTLTIS
jgi:hypothetical protein